MLIGSMLTNSESWINLTQQDLDKLLKRDTLLQKKLLSESGNPSKCFMLLELGVLTVKYVIMTKRLTFLRYILGESISSMVGQVYSALKQESWKGDFVNLVQADLQEVKINPSDESILSVTKSKWKNMRKRKVIQVCFEHLVNENSTKEKAKSILFEKLEMAKYLQNSKSK